MRPDATVPGCYYNRGRQGGQMRGATVTTVTQMRWATEITSGGETPPQQLILRLDARYETRMRAEPVEGSARTRRERSPQSTKLFEALCDIRGPRRSGASVKTLRPMTDQGITNRLRHQQRPH